MVTPIPKTAWMPAGIDACGLYRMFIPHLHVPDSAFMFAPRLSQEMIADYEVVVVQRQVTDGNLKALKMMRKLGKKIVYDLDDNMWALPSTNPAQKHFQQMAKGFGVCAQQASVVTVSTMGLKNAVQREMPSLKCDILVTPNALDFNLYKPSELQKDEDRTLIGWAGSGTHEGDLREISGVFPKVLDKNKSTYVEFVGMEPPDWYERMCVKAWVPVGEFPSRFCNWSWDICVAPLENIRFNKSKSCLKMLECAALRIPCLVSDVQPYREFCALGGKELEWLICDFSSQWISKLNILINDLPYRKHIGELMYQVAKRHFDIERVKDNWIYALNTALGRA